MVDFLDTLAKDARKTIDEGYYEVPKQGSTEFRSLKKAILECIGVPIIAEVKVASLSLGVIKENADVEKIAVVMENSGVAGISVLTEPKHFRGSLKSFVKIRRRVELPLLMKDVITSPLQLEAASRIGANAVLLIQGLFDRRYCEYDVHEMIAYAHSRDLEVLLEVHSQHELLLARDTNADLMGINNRDLGTLEVSLETTKRIMEKNDLHGKVVVSESGIKTPADISFLRDQGVHAFLIGTSIMMSDNVEGQIREFRAAYGPS